MSRIDDFVKWWVAHQKPSPAPGKAAVRIMREGIETFWSMISDSKSVLDIGCGCGECLEIFAALGVGRCVGLTNQERECDFVRKKNFACLLQDMHNMTVEDGDFDLVFSRRAVEHSPVPFYLLSEMKRIAKKYIAIVAPGYPFRTWTDSHCSVLPNLVWEEWGKRLGLTLLLSEMIELEKGQEMRLLFKC